MQLAHSWGMAGPKHKARDDKDLTFWERLQKASRYADIPCTPTDVAKELDVGPSAITKYVNGGFPKRERINQLAIKRGVASEWLSSGIGDMITEDALDEETLEMLRIWRTLPADAKERLLVNLRYEHTAAENLTTGKRQILTEELIKLLSSQQTKNQ